MVGEFYWRHLNDYKKPYREVTQTEIVQAIHNNTNNDRAKSMDETAKALDYVLDLKSNYSTVKSGTYSANEIYTRLWTNRQLVLIRVASNENDGHALVIHGIEINGDDTNVDIIDPWSGGQDLNANLNALKNSGYRPSDNRTWTHTININKKIA